MLCQMLHDHARHRDPELADRLVGVPLFRIVHTDAVLHCDVRRSQIPPEYLFVRRHGELFGSGVTRTGGVLGVRAIESSPGAVQETLV
jgi:hypothetical protein